MQPHTSILVLLPVATLTVIGLVLLNQHRELPAEMTSIAATKDDAQYYSLAQSDPSRKSVLPVESRANGLTEVIKSLYDADREFREAALAEADRFMADFDQGQYSVLRWEPVWIKAEDLLFGSHLKEYSMAQEFRISPFPFLTYRATQIEYRVWEVNNQASWLGVLDDGQSGTIEINVSTNEQALPVFMIRMRTESHDIAIVPMNIYGTYVALDANRDGARIVQ